MSHKKAPFSMTRLVLPVLAALTIFAPLPAKAEPGLAFDSDHDVIVLDGCDVAVRYNNKSFVPVKAKLLDTSSPAFLKTAPEKAIKIWEDYESAKMGGAPEQIFIESYDIGKIGAFGTSRFNKDFMANNRVREVQFTNERVGKETGLSESSFIGITAVKAFEVAPKSGEAPYYVYAIQTPDRLTVFARKMRATSRSFDLDPAVIVTQLRVRGSKDCQANIKLDAPAASVTQ
jgi:hypothetical protein